MISMIRTTFFSLLAISSFTHAATPVSGFYAGGFFGATYQHNINFNVTNTTSYIPTSVVGTNDTGILGYSVLVDAGGQLGYRFCDNYRVEIQGLYNNNPYNFLRIGNYTFRNNTSSTAGLRLDGSTTSGIGFFNAYYDFLGDDSESSVAPFVGLGVGYAYIYNVAKLYYNDVLVNPTGTGAKLSKTAPAGQVILGMSYFMDDFMSVGVDARYYATASTTFTNRLNNSFDTQMQIYAVNLFFNGALEFG
jgi:hypothetical protein